MRADTSLEDSARLKGNGIAKSGVVFTLLLLGASGALVLAKLLGVLLSALAVQYVIDGARAVLTG